MQLQDKRIIVTGSTAGIGRAIAEAMLQAGARVVVNSFEPEIASADLASLQQMGECHYVAADLSTVEGARQAVQQAHELLGGLDCLVNNAGTCVEKPFVEFGEEDFAKTIDLNIRGYFFASQEFARLAGQCTYDASIICIGSSNSLQAETNQVAYDASKGAVLMMVRSMCVDLAKQGIRVNGVGPGLIKTQLTDWGLQSEPETAALICRQIPVGRIGDPEDIGGAAVFLASDAARYITGQMLYVDGGIVAQQMNYE
jgi:NAD(P)-dependent dehydrogenase (short-subunit alcohol dehydrogenase family)